MPRFKDDAIVIREIDWSESSQVVGLLTAQHGLVRGVAKGAKRMSPGSIARFSGGIDLLTRGQVVANVKPSADLATLTEWDLADPYRHLREDLSAHRLGMYGADLVGAMIADRDPHPAAFTALAALLDALRDESHRPEALLRFQWAVLGECGYRPELDKDVKTGEALATKASYTFDPRAGGLTCEKAPGRGDAPAGPWRVRAETVKLLRGLGGDNAHPDAEAAAIERANKLLCVYVRSILDRELPTMGYVLKSK